MYIDIENVDMTGHVVHHIPNVIFAKTMVRKNALIATVKINHNYANAV